MLLSIRYNFLFIHIAKTGGTSIRKALDAYKWKDAHRIPMAIASRLSAFTGHRIGAKIPRHAKAVTALEMLPREMYQGLFKFVFVRNPWDLQVSSYHHLKRERPHLLEGLSGFGDFLRFKLDPERPPQYHLDMSTTLQSDYIVDLHGNVIVDFIGRYERLAADFDEACRCMKLPRTPELPHKRKAARRQPYQSYYTKETRQMVAEHYKTDINRFGYAF